MNAPNEIPTLARPAVAVKLLLDAPPAVGRDPAFVFDCAELPGDPSGIEAVVLRSAGAGQARALLSQGVPCVYLGEAALLDSSVVEKLSAEFGSERIGIHVPARRMQVSWSMDAVSNADFRVMTPSVCEPCLEILRADGTRSGTHAAWWIGEMFKLGASRALIQADIGDDADLNILAGLTERWGERLWLTPLNEANPDFEAWVGLGGAAQLAVSDPSYQANPYLVALRDAAPIEHSSEAIG